jgi:uncharacterized RDD family membrane protein YckC
MKCPKCGYLGFDHAERCRNCGYDFSLAAPPLPDLSIREGDPRIGPLEDLALGNHTAPEPSKSEVSPPRTSRLPLFGAAPPADEPLITKPSPPRAPLAVRRATPAPRGRPPNRPEMLDLALEDPPDASTATPHRTTTPSDAMADAVLPDNTEHDAPVGFRLTAVAIDALILAVVDLCVVYLTMQVCGVDTSELRILLGWPLFAFLAGLNGAYLVVFTAGGQTLGKMAVGIKVVPQQPEASVDLGRALTRELTWILLALPAGLGFLTVLSSGHRGLHDRFAGTRVVR